MPELRLALLERALDAESVAAGRLLRSFEVFDLLGASTTQVTFATFRFAQAVVVAFGIALVARESGREEVEKLLTIFTDCQVDFSGTVKPGDRVTTTGRKKFWRRKKLRAEFEMKLDDGTVVCSGEVSGMGVPR